MEDFQKLSKISEEKEKKYKRDEFSSQLQAYFTLLMWKNVCSEEGENIFVEWVKKLIINNDNLKKSINTNESEDDSFNPDPNKYVDINNLKTLYDILDVKNTHGIDFQNFFDLMKLTSKNIEETEHIEKINDDYVLISVLDFFCIHFIRGLSTIIYDLGFDGFMESDF